ncbi:hypothetical protein GQ42DRAFT_166097 [Ramicandelaber brevisporus]|nr:hypothetical protein GQ42DRAFT_166097 [Ramicandelaber brevisporus]
MHPEASTSVSKHTGEAQAATNSPTASPEAQSPEATCWISTNNILAKHIKRLLGSELLSARDLQSSTIGLCRPIVNDNRRDIPVSLLLELRVFEALVRAAALCQTQEPQMHITGLVDAIRFFPLGELESYYTKTEFPMERRAWLYHTFNKARNALHRLNVDTSIIRLLDEVVRATECQQMNKQAESENKPLGINKKSE